MNRAVHKRNDSNLVVDAVSIFAIVAIPTYVFTFMRHFYYGTKWIDYVSYTSMDGPTFPGESKFPLLTPEHAFGFHYFGDYLFPHMWAFYQNPWLENSLVMYPPLALYIFKFFALFPYKVGIGIYLTSLAFALMAPIWHATKTYSLHLRVAATFVLAAMAGPFIITLDRGNLIGYLPLLYYLFGISILKRKWFLATIFASIAIALKYFPLVLLLAFVVTRKFRYLFLCCVQSIFLVFGLAFTFPGSKFDTAIAVVRQALPFAGGDPERFICYNNSFLAGLEHIFYALGFSRLATVISTEAVVVSLTLGALCAVLILIMPIEIQYKLLLITSLSWIFMPRINSYSVNLAISNLAILLYSDRVSSRNFHSDGASENKDLVNWQNRFKLRLLVFACILALVPMPFVLQETFELGCETSFLTVTNMLSVVLLWTLIGYFTLINRHISFLRQMK